MKKYASNFATSALLALLALSCGGSSNSVPTRTVVPGSITVGTENSPNGDLSLTYTMDSKNYYPIFPGITVTGLTPGSYLICATSQIRNTTDLYTPYWTRLDVEVHSGENAPASVIYSHQFLASGNIEYHVSGFPSGASPQIGRFIVIGDHDNAWVHESISPDQPVVTVPTAAGDWDIGGQLQDVNGKTYTVTPSPSNVSVLPGQTAVVTLSYTVAP
jgi:hypothetical protein